MRYVEIGRKVSTGSDAVIRLPYIQNTLVLLGWFAIFLNLIFLLITIILKVSGKQLNYSHWIIYFNVLIFFMADRISL